MPDGNPWDAAHELIRSAASLAAAPDFVEPDLIQTWTHQDSRHRPGGSLAADKATCSFDDQDTSHDLPGVPGAFAWHLGDDFSQLRTARAIAGSDRPKAIRIAHLDTGYDPEHSTYPRLRVDAELQRNFIDPDRPRDARDLRAEGPLKNPGHGTGTLGILAGARFRFAGPGYTFDDVLGGAPNARIVPVRVGNSVVQITTSSVAQGIGYAADLCRDEATRVDVLSMSMGGVASAAWADAVNRAYEAGVVLVTAAGNNFSAGFFGVPTHFIVYPARFRRVVAACGVMANRRPYDGLSVGVMQGNWGPDSKMATAIAAFTPNVPWAQIGCREIVDMDGAGTSAATPQVAAAAALYVQAHADRLFDASKYPQAWMRVEAVRRALFESADRSPDGGRPTKLGNGLVRAAEAIALTPADASVLRKTPADSASFAFLRVLTGIGVAPAAGDGMFELEATQLAQRWPRSDSPNPLDTAVADPDLDPHDIPPQAVRQFLQTIEAHPDASDALRKRVREVLGKSGGGGGGGEDRLQGRRGPRLVPTAAGRPASPGAKTAGFSPPAPPFRRLRGFALDPSLATTLDTAAISRTTFSVPWEPLKPGPIGEYLEVIDADPASRCYYEPVDLDNPLLLAQDGLPPSEGSPQFHQQMAYAVCSLTIRNFEHALGRRALWRPGPPPASHDRSDDSVYVPRLRVYPHALREANAYYSPEKIGLLFGYFNAGIHDPGDHIPGGRVFTCLSHDIVAHETTHALLDGMHRRFLLASNPDVLAFHEAFADIVALFQHFTMPDIVRHQIASVRGEVRTHESLLGQLATEFGRATGARSALRDAIGTIVDGAWTPHRPNPDEYQTITEPHARGSILVGAVFDAFLSIYERRTADLLRLASGGSGILRPGAIHPDLVRRLSDEAAKSAQHVLTMCIRALDYCPPTDITFGEYLRALITADYDLVPDDDLKYRIAFVEAFRKRGLYPRDLRTLSVESLLWRSPKDEAAAPSAKWPDFLERLRDYANDHVYAKSREDLFHLQRAMRRDLHGWMRSHFAGGADGLQDAAFLGLAHNGSGDAGGGLFDAEGDPTGDRPNRFEVHTARFAYRTSPDGGVRPQLLLGILRRAWAPADPEDRSGARMPFEGGCTIVADLRSRRVQYCVRKSVASDDRLARQRAFAGATLDSSRGTYFGPGTLGTTKEPFAALHRDAR